MALIDFSQAFDKVWREELLGILMEKGIPLQFVRWISSFLENRQARVLLNNVLSHIRPMKQGVPQGSVLAPLLFLFFIDSISADLPPEVFDAIFADDVAIWTSDHSKEAALARIQTGVNKLADWAKKKKMLINCAKSEITFFASWSGDAK
jgi:hypothetical protein